MGPYGLRVPASRAGYAPEAQGGLPPRPRVLYVQRVPWHPRCAQPVGVGKSALHAAAEAGHEAVARLLVHADPQAIHARSDALAGRTPLQVGECSSLLTVLTLRT